jgi:hypothetical protein
MTLSVVKLMLGMLMSVTRFVMKCMMYCLESRLFIDKKVRVELQSVHLALLSIFILDATRYHVHVR